ncbi:MAG: hypothetical protein BA862_03375 [Desulfobulbaceae bacterium S3730MH12]|nr:MAG: hypothetical protein BA866_05395 [Desulfobulbaceae bacterium S5133MH15]OEU55864.1 MAG: hypothetical protein BA862_03375 [Desulfobulbaceae bacterium S3730MH12]OEU81699.1 MAG: hypothetical protein BA873_04875 [Desulfobulbaceae bacterium C00003063]
MNKTMMILLVFFLLLPSITWSQPNHVAYLKNVTGEVTILRNNNELKARVGSQLKSSDVVKTHSNSSAGIVFIDNTRLSLGENTEITVNEYKFVPVNQEYAFSLFMKKGKALYSSGKLTKLAPEKVSFQTPRATIGVRGTKFLVQVD